MSTCETDIDTGVGKIIQVTTSLHGGVVNEPL